MVHNIGPVSIDWDSANNHFIIQHPDGSTITLDATGVLELAAQSEFDAHDHSGETLTLDAAVLASQLGAPVYSDDTNAPNETLYFNDTDTLLKYKDSAGTVHSGDSTVQAHDLGGAEHNADTLANLNSKVSDATLDDAGDARPPAAHDHSGETHNPSDLNVGGSDFVADGDVLPIATVRGAATSRSGTNTAFDTGDLSTTLWKGSVNADLVVGWTAYVSPGTDETLTVRLEDRSNFNALTQTEVSFTSSQAAAWSGWHSYTSADTANAIRWGFSFKTEPGTNASEYSNSTVHVGIQL